MADNFGSGVSRVLDPKQAQLTEVIFQQNKPPLDSEFNLLQQLSEDWRQQIVLRGTPSGWLGNETNPSKDFVTNSSWSNWLQFGRQKSGEKRSIMWAVVNGWLIPVTGTKTGTPPGSPNNVDTWNKVTLDPPPSNSGDFRSDFVFLEVWKAKLAPNPSTTNKASATAIYRYGNVESGQSFLTDDLQDPAIGAETTQRVQVQYRIRVVKGLIGLATYPDGFDPSTVKAQGAASATTSFTFTNMRQELGDAGLWRAGDGTANSLGTVDGYTYAVPIAVVFRRNSVAWSGDPSQNLNGGFNRNPTAVDRTGILTFSTAPTLASLMTAATTTLSLTSAASIPLPASPATPVLIQIGDEVMSYVSVTGTTVSGLSRGLLGTVAETHPASATIKVLSGRPDGLYSDQITPTDVLDLRHVVSANGFDYHTLLQSNLDKLLRGQLRANWKRSGGGPQGCFVTYEDRISASAAGLGVTKLDAPDNIRLIFSDAAVQQKVEVICAPRSNTVTSGSQDVTAAWSLAINASTTYQRTANIFGAETSDNAGDGDRIVIAVAQFKNTVPGADGDQVRLLNEVPVEGSTGAATNSITFTDTAVDFSPVHAGDQLVIFFGAARGTYTVVSGSGTSLVVNRAVPTATNVSYVVRRGEGALQIRLSNNEGYVPQHRFKVTPSNPTSANDLTIQIVGAGAPFPTESGRVIYVTMHVQYGSGRGVSRRPDSIHNVQLFNPNADLLVEPSGSAPTHYPTLRSTWALLWSKTRSAAYKSRLPVTTESYFDPGSKTAILTPFRRISFPNTLMATMDGTSVNPYTTTVLSSSTGSATGVTFTDTSVNFTVSATIGDVIKIASGLAAGTYPVTDIPTSTTLTLSRSIPTVASGISYTLHKAQGLMPLNKRDGVTTKWTTTDPLALFSGTTEGTAATKNIYVTLPRHLVPGWSAVHSPVLPTSTGTTFHRGVNFMLQAREGLTVTDSDHNRNYVNYQNGAISYAAMSTGNFSGVSTVTATYNATFSFGGTTYAGSRFFTDSRGLGRKGIELPPFYGIARLWAVYEVSDYKTNGSAFNATTREALVSGGAKNLLRQGFKGPTFWIEIDDDGDSTFVLNADMLDLSKSPTPIASFESAHYVVESSVFGFDRGSFDLAQPFRMVLARTPNRNVADSGTRSLNVGINIPGPTAILPGPMSASDTALVNYSRTPYQGDPWGSQMSYADIPYTAGSLTSSTAFQVASSGLTLSSLTRPNQKAVEVLASVGFYTTLGTGRLSGDTVALNVYDFRNVGYEDPADFPPTSGVSARPDVIMGALETGSDTEVSQDYLGCTERLPLGSLLRDKDFRGGKMSNSNPAPLVYSNGTGAGIGSGSLSGSVTLEQVEIAASTAATTPGYAGDVLVQTDGEIGNYGLLTNYRTLRGGSVFVGSGDRPGGEVYATYDNVVGTGRGTRVLVGRAYLVRNSATSVGSNEASAGDELMMLIATSGAELTTTAQGATVLIGTNGSNEGWAASDLYRIEGHPLIANHIRYEVDPSTITLPNRIT